MDENRVTGDRRRSIAVMRRINRTSPDVHEGHQRKCAPKNQYATQVFQRYTVGAARIELHTGSYGRNSSISSADTRTAECFEGRDSDGYVLGSLRSGAIWRKTKVDVHSVDGHRTWMRSREGHSLKICSHLNLWLFIQVHVLLSLHSAVTCLSRG